MSSSSQYLDALVIMLGTNALPLKKNLLNEDLFESLISNTKSKGKKKNRKTNPASFLKQKIHMHDLTLFVDTLDKNGISKCYNSFNTENKKHNILSKGPSTQCLIGLSLNGKPLTCVFATPFPSKSFSTVTTTGTSFSVSSSSLFSLSSSSSTTVAIINPKPATKMKGAALAIHPSTALPEMTLPRVTTSAAAPVTKSQLTVTVSPPTIPPLAVTSPPALATLPVATVPPVATAPPAVATPPDVATTPVGTTQAATVMKQALTRVSTIPSSILIKNSNTKQIYPMELLSTITDATSRACLLIRHTIEKWSDSFDYSAEEAVTRAQNAATRLMVQCLRQYWGGEEGLRIVFECNGGSTMDLNDDVLAGDGYGKSKGGDLEQELKTRTPLDKHLLSLESFLVMKKPMNTSDMKQEDKVVPQQHLAPLSMSDITIYIDSLHVTFPNNLKSAPMQQSASRSSIVQQLLDGQLPDWQCCIGISYKERAYAGTCCIAFPPDNPSRPELLYGQVELGVGWWDLYSSPLAGIRPSAACSNSHHVQLVDQIDQEYNNEDAYGSSAEEHYHRIIHILRSNNDNKNQNSCFSFFPEAQSLLSHDMLPLSTKDNDLMMHQSVPQNWNNKKIQEDSCGTFTNYCFAENTRKNNITTTMCDMWLLLMDSHVQGAITSYIANNINVESEKVIADYSAPASKYYWKTCAPSAILMASGGKVTNSYGLPLCFTLPQVHDANNISIYNQSSESSTLSHVTIVASSRANSLLHDEMINLLKNKFDDSVSISNCSNNDCINNCSDSEYENDTTPIISPIFSRLPSDILFEVVPISPMLPSITEGSTSEADSDSLSDDDNKEFNDMIKEALLMPEILPTQHSSSLDISSNNNDTDQSCESEKKIDLMEVLSTLVDAVYRACNNMQLVVDNHDIAHNNNPITVECTNAAECIILNSLKDCWGERVMSHILTPNQKQNDCQGAKNAIKNKNEANSNVSTDTEENTSIRKSSSHTSSNVRTGNAAGTNTVTSIVSDHMPTDSQSSTQVPKKEDYVLEYDLAWKSPLNKKLLSAASFGMKKSSSSPYTTESDDNVEEDELLALLSELTIFINPLVESANYANKVNKDAAKLSLATSTSCLQCSIGVTHRGESLAGVMGSIEFLSSSVAVKKEEDSHQNFIPPKTKLSQPEIVYGLVGKGVGQCDTAYHLKPVAGLLKSFSLTRGSSDASATSAGIVDSATVTASGNRDKPRDKANMILVTDDLTTNHQLLATTVSCALQIDGSIKGSNTNTSILQLPEKDIDITLEKSRMTIPWNMLLKSQAQLALIDRTSGHHTSPYHEWESCAQEAILTAMGGKVTNLFGDSIQYSQTKSCSFDDEESIACNIILASGHDETPQHYELLASLHADKSFTKWIHRSDDNGITSDHYGQSISNNNSKVLPVPSTSPTDDMFNISLLKFLSTLVDTSVRGCTLIRNISCRDCQDTNVTSATASTVKRRNTTGGVMKMSKVMKSDRTQRGRSKRTSMSSLSQISETSSLSGDDDDYQYNGLNNRAKNNVPNAASRKISEESKESSQRIMTRCLRKCWGEDVRIIQTRDNQQQQETYPKSSGGITLWNHEQGLEQALINGLDLDKELLTHADFKTRSSSCDGGAGQNSLPQQDNFSLTNEIMREKVSLNDLTVFIYNGIDDGCTRKKSASIDSQSKFQCWIGVALKGRPIMGVNCAYGGAGASSRLKRIEVVYGLVGLGVGYWDAYSTQPKPTPGMRLASFSSSYFNQDYKRTVKNKNFAGDNSSVNNATSADNHNKIVTSASSSPILAEAVTHTVSTSFFALTTTTHKTDDESNNDEVTTTTTMTVPPQRLLVEGIGAKLQIVMEGQASFALMHERIHWSELCGPHALLLAANSGNSGKGMNLDTDNVAKVTDLFGDEVLYSFKNNDADLSILRQSAYHSLGVIASTFGESDRHDEITTMLQGDSKLIQMLLQGSVAPLPKAMPAAAGRYMSDSSSSDTSALSSRATNAKMVSLVELLSTLVDAASRACTLIRHVDAKRYSTASRQQSDQTTNSASSAEAKYTSIPKPVAEATQESQTSNMMNIRLKVENDPRSIITEADCAAQRLIMESVQLFWGKDTFILVGEEEESDDNSSSTPGKNQKKKRKSHREVLEDSLGHKAPLDRNLFHNNSCFATATNDPISSRQRSSLPPEVLQSDITIFVDPVDGTGEFVHERKQNVTCLIGVAYKGRAIAGVCGIPFPAPLSLSTSASVTQQQSKPHIVYGLVGWGVGWWDGIQPPVGGIIPSSPVDLSMATDETATLSAINKQNSTNRRATSSKRLIVTGSSTSRILSSAASHALSTVTNSSRIRVGGAGNKMMLLLSATSNPDSNDMMRNYGGELASSSSSLPSSTRRKDESSIHMSIYNDNTYLWDTCAPEAILVAWGGTVTDLFGGPLVYSLPHNYTDDTFLNSCSVQTTNNIKNQMRNSLGVLASCANATAMRDHGKITTKLRGDHQVLKLLSPYMNCQPLEPQCVDIARHIDGFPLTVEWIAQSLGSGGSVNTNSTARGSVVDLNDFYELLSYTAPDSEAIRGVMTHGCRLHLNWAVKQPQQSQIGNNRYPSLPSTFRPPTPPETVFYKWIESRASCNSIINETAGSDNSETSTLSSSGFSRQSSRLTTRREIYSKNQNNTRREIVSLQCPRERSFRCIGRNVPRQVDLGGYILTTLIISDAAPPSPPPSPAPSP